MVLEVCCGELVIFLGVLAGWAVGWVFGLLGLHFFGFFYNLNFW